MGSAAACAVDRLCEIRLMHAVGEHNPGPIYYLTHSDRFVVHMRKIPYDVAGNLSLVDGGPEGGKFRGGRDDRLVAVAGRGPRLVAVRAHDAFQQARDACPARDVEKGRDQVGTPLAVPPSAPDDEQLDGDRTHRFDERRGDEQVELG